MSHLSQINLVALDRLIERMVRDHTESEAQAQRELATARSLAWMLSQDSGTRSPDLASTKSDPDASSHER